MYTDCGGCDHCSGSLFLSGTEPDVSQQYFRSWDRAVAFCAASVVGDHNDFKYCAPCDRFFDLRKRIWRKDGVYKYYAAAVFGAV